jgi:NADH:ubiquinone oxidoreductase subunit K
LGTRSKRNLPVTLERIPSAGLTESEDFSSARVTKEALGIRLQSQTITLRKDYGKAMLSLVIGQVVAVNVYFVLIGTATIHIDADVFKTFAVSVFAEIVALALVVTRSLFPPPSNSMLDSIGDLVSKSHSDSSE